MKSLLKELTALLITVLIVVIAFLLWTNAYYTSQLLSQINRESTNTLYLWESMTESRLSSLDDRLFQIMLTIYNNTTVKSGTGSMSFDVRKKCQDLIEDYLIISSDADCYSIKDTDTDWLLFSAQTGLGSSRVTQLKNFARDSHPELYVRLYDKNWSVAKIDGETYFVKTVALGKYLVSTFCRAQVFDIIDGLDYDNTSSLMIVSGDTIYYAGGANDWSDELVISGSGSFRMSKHTVVSSEFSLVGGYAVYAVQTSSFFTGSAWVSLFVLLLTSLICVALIVRLVFIFHRKVFYPTQELLRAHQEMGSGNIEYRITTDAGSREFNTLYSSFNDMAGQIRSLKIESYDNLIREQENRFRMVRAQVRPHFYLNAITVISNMTYQNRLEDIRTYIQALAKHLRYMLNIQSQWISLSEELEHIKNYLKMQQLRFPDSVTGNVICSDEAAKTQVPFLIVFTLVENTFKHALSLYKPMELNISCTITDDGKFCSIKVEDNGDGFPAEVLEEFQTQSAENALPSKDHLGLSNVRYTLNYIYKRSDLLRLSNKEGGGAVAQILIPLTEEEK